LLPIPPWDLPQSQTRQGLLVQRHVVLVHAALLRVVTLALADPVGAIHLLPLTRLDAAGRRTLDDLAILAVR